MSANSSSKTHEAPLNPANDSPKAVTVQTKGIDQEIIRRYRPKNEMEFNFRSLNNEEADRAISQIRHHARNLKILAHETAVGILMHYQEHGDYTKISDLLAAIREGMGKNMSIAFVDWVVRFSSLKWRTIDASKATGEFYHVKKADRKFDMEKASHETNAFWSFEKLKTAPKAIDALTVIASALKRLETLYEQKTAGVTINDPKTNTDRTVKVEHENLDDKLISDFMGFAKAHGVQVGNVQSGAPTSETAH